MALDSDDSACLHAGEACNEKHEPELCGLIAPSRPPQPMDDACSPFPVMSCDTCMQGLAESNTILAPALERITSGLVKKSIKDLCAIGVFQAFPSSHRPVAVFLSQAA